MRDQPLIYAGLAVFLAAVTFPVTWNLAAGASARPPELKRPAGKQCVAPTAYMRQSHMSLLIDWREQVVRNGVRTWRAADGASYDISLSRTCIERCHGSRQEFCDRCHSYVGVKGPYCMDCHFDPKLVAEGGRR